MRFDGMIARLLTPLHPTQHAVIPHFIRFALLRASDSSSIPGPVCPIFGSDVYANLPSRISAVRPGSLATRHGHAGAR